MSQPFSNPTMEAFSIINQSNYLYPGFESLTIRPWQYFDYISIGLTAYILATATILGHAL